MKRIICALLACLLLCACASAPVLKEGYYLAPMEDTGGSPMYFCLKTGGTGFVHVMGQDTPITWTPEGLEDLFSDGVVTEDGIEFPDGIVYPYSKTLPDEYLQPILKPGFYISEGEEFDSLMCYAELREDGTGEFSIMGMARPIEWEPTKFYFGDLIVCATETGFSMTEDGLTSNFCYVGDALPEGYLPDPPAPGTYYISSVGYQGDMSLFGAPDPDRNGLVLNDDGTGVFAFRGEQYPLTWEGSMARLEGGYSLMLVDMGDQGEDPPLVFGYVMEVECPIEADSIAFRLLEGE